MPVTIQHGVFLSILGMGVFITGKSGVGKSQLALLLVDRGHALIADDAVSFSKEDNTLISGCCPEKIKNQLHIKSFGLINIKDHYGEQAVCAGQTLSFIVHLTEEKIDRDNLLEPKIDQHNLLDQPITRLSLPARSPELVLLIETAVRNIQAGKYT